MKTGISVFLVAFVAFCASWFGLVYAPIKQLGGEQQTVILQSSDTWPQQRAGEATLGLQVYRASGCAACHTEQIRQSGAANEITLTSLGNHQAADFKEFIKSLMIVPELMNYSNDIVGNLASWNGELPKTLYSGDDNAVVGALGQRLKPAGVKTEARVVAIGADISRGWGTRRSVAADYLYDSPPQLGSLRAGPDLATIGVRSPDVNWQLQHLYAPRSLVKNSTMPAFRYLFAVRKIGAQPAPDALVLPKEFAPADGFEVVPTPEAKELAAYLVSLKNNAPLYEAPFTPITAAK
ncbi:MAG TPA: cbb3-type cytochrome c oxidase subunit II [Verrucomicrobiae bacterium]